MITIRELTQVSYKDQTIRGLIEIARQLDNIQEQVTQIQGQTEDLQYQSQATQDRQRALYVDLDDRFARS